MTKKYIIVGLRAMDPLPFHYEDCLPGYLSFVTEKHRRGFMIEAGNWCAFVTDPMNAAHFYNYQDAEFILEQVLKCDKGRFRPMTIVSIYL